MPRLLMIRQHQRLQESASASSSVSAQVTETPMLARGSRQRRRGPEALAVVADHRLAPLRADEVREREGPAQLRRVRPAHRRRSQQPQLRHPAHLRGRAHAAERMLRRQVAGQVAVQVHQLLGVVLDAQRARPVRQRPRGATVAARRAPHPQVDAARVHRLDHVERLGHLERAVVAQHHPARPDPDALRARRDLRDHHLRRRAGQRRRVVVLGQPVALVAQPVRQLRQGEGLPDRLRAVAARHDRDLVQDAQSHAHSLETARRPVPALAPAPALRTLPGEAR